MSTGTTRGRAAALAVALLPLAACQSPATPQACLAAPATDGTHAGMVRLAGGTFTMGAAAERAEEGPPRQVRVGAFWIDATEVTNAQFARFVEATGYRTLAERGLSAETYPGLSAAARAPASLVFVGADAKDRGDPGAWWRIVPGADWRHPKGPGSSLRGLENHPVVHIAYEDALAYARWRGRDLPTEAEWEFAARGGLEGAAFVWGDEKGQAARANTWQGVFPVADTGDDGHAGKTAPVGCFAPNGYGLYDMAGNVWEWTRDWYAPGLEPAAVIETGGPPQSRARAPGDPGLAKHVIKGGSFLCADDYCYRYRPAARTPGPPDSGASHLGFRTVLREAG
ncbi:MAG: formylglycine-generating enzyme family protein [Phenylobacterium sp.]|uniref:formylglycine-generating enzyme family protein n=1 Tax=Phenylobacterium sp. TaxID=1871053 RepID=UPI00391D1C0B